MANDNNNKGLASTDMEEETKSEIQKKGGQASRGDQNPQESGLDDQSFETGDQGALGEQGRDEKVSDAPDQGGQSSREEDISQE